MKFLVTGFEPFGGDAINSSQETVRAVDCGEFGEIEVVTYILPVSFNKVEKALCGLGCMSATGHTLLHCTTLRPQEETPKPSLFIFRKSRMNGL
jgi:hypothetical protein